MMFNWFKNSRPQGKIVGVKTLQNELEYTGELAEHHETMRGLAIELLVQDEWEAYRFTEEVMEEARKIGERRLRSEELLNSINFKLAPMEWKVEYIPDDVFTNVLIKYGMPL